MSETKRARRWTNILGLTLGAVTVVWLVGWSAAAPVRPANPTPPTQPPPPPGCSSAPQPGGIQLGFVQLGGTFVPAPVSLADAELRMHYPLESLAEQLDYEPAALKRLADEGPAPQLPATARKRLAVLEERFAAQMPAKRTLRLMKLHTDQVFRFVQSPGFGGQRLGTPQFQGSPYLTPAQSTGLKPEDLELPGGAPIAFASVRDTTLKSGDDAPNPPKPDRLMALHINGLFDFFDPAGFGYVMDRDHVAGFEPHQFRHMPEMPPEKGAARMEKWAVVRLELVSLLKHDRPVVYAADVLPNMTDAYRPETRELTAFEEKALKTLRKGDDLATESVGDRIRVLGSLRATKQCMDCHQVERGFLLGAFSWELQRQPADGGR
jgi:hypothetical protein